MQGVESFDRGDPVSGLFDLPTVAQWEYACRAGTTSAYNNGGGTATDLELLGRYIDNGNAHTTVGSYASNAWGLYDMHGNIWEVCLDYWSASPENLPVVDPVGPTTSEPKNKDNQDCRTIRGGRWTMKPAQIRSANRDMMIVDPSIVYATGNYGLRVFLTVK